MLMSRPFLPAVKALAEPSRLRLVNILRRHELSVKELAVLLATRQPSISRHLKLLAEAGVLTPRREGLWVFHALAGEGPGRDLVEALAPYMDADPTFAEDLAQAEALVNERAKASREFVDTIADHWDAMRREVLGAFDLSAAILSRLPLGGDDETLGEHLGTVVDLGCGAGHLLPMLLDHLAKHGAGGAADPAHIIGVDHSPRMLQLAGERLSAIGAPFVSLRLGGLEALPLRDAEADAAVLSMVLPYLGSPAEAFAEVFRALSPGSPLIIADLAPHEREDLRQRFGHRRLGTDPALLAQELAHAGFNPGEPERVPVNLGLSVLLLSAQKPV